VALVSGRVAHPEDHLGGYDANAAWLSVAPGYQAPDIGARSS
jgi:hypothetical protein